MIGVFFAYAGILAGNHDNLAVSPLSIILGVSIGNLGGAVKWTAHLKHFYIYACIAVFNHFFIL